MFVTFSAFAGMSVKSQHTWKKFDDVDEVTLYKAEVPGNDVVAFRGETIINAPIERLISAFGDQKRKPEWMHDLLKVVTVQKFSKTKKIEYYHSAAPWPLDERDFLYMSEFDYFSKEKTFVLNLKNVTHKDYPVKKGIVRAMLYESNYFISKTDDPKKTKIAAEILFDPMGAVPKWVVNFVQKAWPVNTLNGLRKLMKDETFKTNNQVIKFIKLKEK
jgi:hypothetical protein